MKQRSKTQWLNLGDPNTRFFNIATKIRRSKNSTLKVLNSDGSRNMNITRPQLESNSIDYFKNLFNSPTTSLPSFPIIFPKLVSPLMNDWLTQLPTEEEVRTTLFSFQTGKSPDPDGFTAEFSGNSGPKQKQQSYNV